MSNSIDQLAKDCGKGFERLEEQLEYPAVANTTKYDEYVGFKNLQSRFTRWKGNVGADSLEKQLHNRRVKLQIIRLLSHIQRLLEDAHAITVGDQVPWDQADEDEDSQSDDEREPLENSPETEMKQILAHVGDAIDSLSYLGVALRVPFADSRTMDEAPPSEPFDVQHVLSKYPGVDKVIAERLGKAISARRELFQHQGWAEQSAQHSKGLLLDEPTLDARVRKLDLEELNYQGSERRGPLDDNSSETSSIASEDLGEHQIPPLPQRATEGRPFRCPFCRHMVRALSTKAWKKHVYRDLRPYICLESNCSEPQHQYARQQDWINHILDEHWRIYVCPFGCKIRFSSRNECRVHLCREHIDQKHLSEIDDLVQLSTVDKTKIPVKTTCPLCKKPLQDIETYRSHIGKHQKQLALLAISLPTMAEEASLQPRAEIGIDEDHIASHEIGSSENEGLVSMEKGKKAAVTPDDSGLGEQSDKSISKFDPLPSGKEARWEGRRKSQGQSFAGSSSSSNPGRQRGGLSHWQCCNCDCGWMRIDANSSCPACQVPRCGNCIYF